MTVNGKRLTTRIRENSCVPRKDGTQRTDKIPRNPFDLKKAIVVPFDFSPASEHALEHAISHARNSGSEIRIVHVLEGSYGHGLLEKHQKEDWHARTKEGAEERLEKLLASKRCKDVPITIEVRSGLPEYEILKAAEGANTGLIVMGRKTRGPLSRWIFGSVTENVLEGSRYPVLVLTAKTE